MIASRKAKDPESQLMIWEKSGLGIYKIKVIASRSAFIYSLGDFGEGCLQR
jgi:hypothetical protein